MLEINEGDYSWVYQVDSVEVKDDKFVLDGFAFELDKDAVEGAFEIVLQDVESGRNYYLETHYMERKDVNEYFLCEYNYLKSGFKASIKKKKLDLDERDYEVLIRMANDRLTYKTGTYISNGELMYANPTEFKPLDVRGTDLEKIVENGFLRVYRPDYGMYVYQYEGELYWVAEEGYDFDEQGKSIIQYHLDTTQIDKLPQNRLINQWYWDNISFEFSGNELSEWNTGKYRVAKSGLPTEYSIEKIWTGNYVEGWIWQQSFRPWYDWGRD